MSSKQTPFSQSRGGGFWVWGCIPMGWPNPLLEVQIWGLNSGVPMEGIGFRHLGLYFKHRVGFRGLSLFKHSDWRLGCRGLGLYFKQNPVKMGRVGFGGLGLLQANPTPPCRGRDGGVGLKGLEAVSLKYCFGFRGALQFGGRISSLVLGLRGLHGSFRKSVGLALRSVWVSMDFFGALTAQILPRTRDSTDPRKRADAAQRRRTDTRTGGHPDARTRGPAARTQLPDVHKSRF